MGHRKTKGHISNGIIDVLKCKRSFFQTSKMKFNGSWPFCYKLIDSIQICLTKHDHGAIFGNIFHRFLRGIIYSQGQKEFVRLNHILTKNL